MSDRLESLLSKSRRPKIMVVGDVMLDRYLWGDVDRISPEGPVPVLHVDRREDRLGGAGSVVAMLAALASDVQLVSFVGDDAEGLAVRSLLTKFNVKVDCIPTVPGRTTTVKERLLGRSQSRYPQQMMRVDREQVEPAGELISECLLSSIWHQLDQVDLIIVSDYNKGLFQGEFMPKLTAIARAANVPIIADPACNVDFSRYAGCACITPNRTEAGLALGRKIVTPSDGLAAAKHLLKFDVDTAVVTLDQDGIAWANWDGESELFSIRPRQVFDITGAGDMVISVIGYCLAIGINWRQAIELANLAAGLQIERLGSTPVTRNDLLDELTSSHLKAETKIVAAKRLRSMLSDRRKAGDRIVMTNGCYDLLHPGHVASLQYAKSHGDCLVVGVNSDRSATELKGVGHPITDQDSRAEMLTALECVDYVVVFDDSSVANLVQEVMPDILVKSNEYALNEVVGHDIVQRNGGRVVLAPMKENYSTTNLLRTIRSENIFDTH